MASLIAKKKGNQLYYYVVESARVDGRPRIVHQSYLGSAERVAALVRDRTAPVPLSATMRDFGLPGALWLAAQQTGLFDLLEQLRPQSRSGPSTAHYLLLAAIHRICQPGPKTEVADWYDRTVLQPLWGFAAERFTSQAFWDCFDALAPERPSPGACDELEQAQLRLVGLWKQKQLISRRLLGYRRRSLFAAGPLPAGPKTRLCAGLPPDSPPGFLTASESPAIPRERRSAPHFRAAQPCALRGGW